MAYDQIFTLEDNLGIELRIIPVALNLDKEIYLLHIFEEENTLNKKYIRNFWLRIINTHSGHSRRSLKLHL